MSAEIKAVIIVVLFLLLVAGGGFAGWKYKSNSDRADTAEAQVALQGTVIQAQADQSRAFNSLASAASGQNTQADTKSEETVIEYRTILKREKTCDMPVPADIAGGLLDYTNRLRTRAVSATSGGTDEAGSRTTAPSQLTYCQAVLWINPLLAAIEKANNQLSAIRQAEQLRQGKTQ